MRVVIADDIMLIRSGLAGLLIDAGVEVVGEAGDAEALLRLVAVERPDVAVIDIRMPPPTPTKGWLRRGESVKAGRRRPSSFPVSTSNLGTRSGCLQISRATSGTCSRNESLTSPS